MARTFKVRIRHRHEYWTEVDVETNSDWPDQEELMLKGIHKTRTTSCKVEGSDEFSSVLHIVPFFENGDVDEEDIHSYMIDGSLDEYKIPDKERVKYGIPGTSSANPSTDGIPKMPPQKGRCPVCGGEIEVTADEMGRFIGGGFDPFRKMKFPVSTYQCKDCKSIMVVRKPDSMYNIE